MPEQPRPGLNDKGLRTHLTDGNNTILAKYSEMYAIMQEYTAEDIVNSYQPYFSNARILTTLSLSCREKRMQRDWKALYTDHKDSRTAFFYDILEAIPGSLVAKARPDLVNRLAIPPQSHIGVEAHALRRVKELITFEIDETIKNFLFFAIGASFWPMNDRQKLIDYLTKMYGPSTNSKVVLQFPDISNTPVESEFGAIAGLLNSDLSDSLSVAMIDRANKGEKNLFKAGTLIPLEYRPQSTASGHCPGMPLARTFFTGLSALMRQHESCLEQAYAMAQH